MTIDQARPDLQTLPLIDLAGFRDPARREEFLAQLRHAAHDVGFFYVVGHGVPDEVPAAVMEQARAFFALPEADRLEIENVASPQFRGYSRVGTERTAGAADQRDQIDVGPEREALADVPADRSYLGLVGPNQWPSALPTLRPAVLRWLEEAERVSHEVLRALATALGQTEDYFDGWFDDESHTHLKVVHYPGRERAESDQGVGAHKDYGWLALLLQDDLGGLQVEAKDGTWIDAVPVPGAFVVNIGEMLEVATQGYLRATRHRVVTPAAGRDRYSIPVFLGPRLDAVVRPLTLPPELAAGATGVEQDPANPILAEYGRNQLRGWLRSHPRVAERWWSHLS